MDTDQTHPQPAAWPNALRCLVIAALAGVFALCGVRGFRAARSMRTDGHGPLGSTDAVLVTVLQSHGAASQILDALSHFPASQPVAVVTRADDVFGPILLQAIGSITWPRDIHLVQVANADTLARAIKIMRNDGFAAAFFIGVPVPADPANRQIGTMTVVPISR